MRDLYDIYEDGAMSTPANTMGMGNPMPPTDGEVGSEPICTAKCKKEKKRKKKVDESSILGKTSERVKEVNIKSDVARWFAESQNINNPTKVLEIAAIYETQLIDNGDGTFDIDTSLNTNKGWSLDLFNIPKEGIPEWLKIRNVKVDFHKVSITSWTGDLHNLNWRFLGGRTVDTDVDIRFSTNDNLVLGPIRCAALHIFNAQSKQLDIDDGVVVTECALRYCQNLKYVSGIPKGCKSVSLPDPVIEEFLKDNGLIPKTAKLIR